MLIKLAPYVLGGAVVVMLIYEVIALWNHQAGDTISEIVWNYATKRPLVPFLLGLLMGHLFWQRGTK